MTGLETWLKDATRHLAEDSVAKVRTEIGEHFELVRDAAVSDGATTEDAERIAITALGDARVANCQYRRVLLTSSEARLLREGNWEARAFCTRPWLKQVVLVILVMIVGTGSALLLTGHRTAAENVLLCGLGVSPLFAAFLLQIYTPVRGRIFRIFKWSAMIFAVVLLFGPDALRWSWLLFSCLWPLAWIEWTRASIRQKLPSDAWPRHLYL